MASESTDSGDVTVSLPNELVEWLDTHAAERDVDRDALVAQLLATYRKTAEAEGEIVDPAAAAVDREDVEPIVRDVLAERQSDIAATVAEELDREDETADLAERLTDLEADFQEKLTDVRERVIQVKREADAKAAADHTHDGLERIGDLADRLDDLAGDLAALEAEVETLAAQSALDDLSGTVEEHDEQLTGFEERLDDVEDKLRTVGWAVSDLREAQRERGTDTLDRIKAAAADHGISRARCENCGDGVEIALMTRPACPHCDAAVTNVEPASGWFGKPALVTASQIEGKSDDEGSEDISATGQGEYQ